MRKMCFINVSSSSIANGQAMRTRADNPIAIHHQPERYTTIASLSLIIFPPPPPSFLNSSFFCSRIRVLQNRTHVTAVYCFPAACIAPCEWLSGVEREANRLLSSIKCHRPRTDTVSKIVTRFFLPFFFIFRSGFVVGVRRRHGVLKNHRAKSLSLILFSRREEEAGFETLSNSGITNSSRHVLLLGRTPFYKNRCNVNKHV